MLVSRLKDLFRDPQSAWQKISDEYIPSYTYILRNYILPWFLVLPVPYLIASLLRFQGWRGLIFSGLITPAIFLTVFAGILFLAAFVIDEASEWLNGRIHPQAGIKIAFFSSLPFLSGVTFLPVPWLGPFLALTGFIYMILQIIRGGKVLLGFQNFTLRIWFATLVLAFMILASVAAASLLILPFIIHLF